MVNRFRLGHTGKFSKQLVIATTQYNKNPVDLTDHSRLFIRFRKPDGKDTIVDATLVGTEITANILLDERGDWNYTVGVEYDDGTIIESVKSELVWVV